MAENVNPFSGILNFRLYFEGITQSHNKLVTEITAGNVNSIHELQEVLSSVLANKHDRAVTPANAWHMTNPYIRTMLSDLTRYDYSDEIDRFQLAYMYGAFHILSILYQQEQLDGPDELPTDFTDGLQDMTKKNIHNTARAQAIRNFGMSDGYDPDHYLKATTGTVDTLIPGASARVKEGAQNIFSHGNEIHRDCFYEGAYFMLRLFTGCHDVELAVESGNICYG